MPVHTGTGSDPEKGEISDHRGLTAMSFRGYSVGGSATILLVTLTVINSFGFENNLAATFEQQRLT